MFRSQSLEDGSSTVILPLWGDFLIKPSDPEYIVEIQASAPIYETRPHEITISQIGNAPVTVEFLFKEALRGLRPCPAFALLRMDTQVFGVISPAGNEQAGRIFEVKSEGAALIAIGQRQLD